MKEKQIFLFQQKIVQKHLQSLVDEIPVSHQEILVGWKSLIDNNKIKDLNETSLDSLFIQRIIKGILGYKELGEAEVYSLTKNLPIGNGNVDVALGSYQSGKEAYTIAPFELKGAKTKDLDAIMPGRGKSPVQQAWEYAMDAKGSKWVIVSNYLEIRLYAIGYGRDKYEVFFLNKLTEIEEYKRFILLLSAENLLTERTRDILKESDNKDKEITDELYSDYKSLRLKLISDLTTKYNNVEPSQLITLAQKILDRILFIAFAEDKGLVPDNSIKKAFEHKDPYNPKPIWESFKGLFKAIDEGNASLNIPKYNGGLFKYDDELGKLEISDDVCTALSNLSSYDYDSQISVTILGHIFEQSITDLEHLKAKTKGEEIKENKGSTSGKRKKEGVVYTPETITRFIVYKTIGSYLEREKTVLLLNKYKGKLNNTKAKEGYDLSFRKASDEVGFWRDYQDILRSLKIVDPACGSGAFLVAAFDYLHEEYTRVNNKLIELKGGNIDLFDLDKEILNSNLYGVDINEESIEISKLSLWLKTAKRGKILTSLDDNLRVGDSLIEDTNYSYRSFNWKEAFPEVFKKGGFDIVLGNPPYVRQELISHLKPYLEKQYEVYNGIADLYTYFFERGLKLLRSQGMLGYICSSTFFKTGSGKNLRRFLSEHATMSDIVDFGDLQLFEGVTTYPAILILTKSIPQSDNYIDFLKLGNELDTDLLIEFNNSANIMYHRQLTENSWNLESESLANLKNKIVDGKPTLKEVYGSPLYGIKTGLNEAFIINKEVKDELIKKDSRANNLIKPFLEGKDLRKWYIEPRELYLILIPAGFTKQQSGLTNEEQASKWLENEYPSIFAHLLNFKDRAKIRTDKGDFWWELRACAYYSEFEKDKIVYPEISQGAKFSLDQSKCYTNKTAFILPKPDYFILGLLNSKVVWYYLFQECTALRGGIWRLNLQSIYIETIPIPKTINKEKLEKISHSCHQIVSERFKLDESFRRRIADLAPKSIQTKLTPKLKNWNDIDFKTFRSEIKKSFKQDIPLQERTEWETFLNLEKKKILSLTNQLNQLEDELNKEVYNLFNLTDEEVKIIETNIN